jgi:CHAD domain-containing protein
MAMAEGKWLSGFTLTTPHREAAARVLEVRFDAVLHWLPRAVEQSHKSLENIHQLRVAARRCDAAIRFAAGACPEKKLERFRKELRRLRRAAGAARDWDVFLLHLETHRKAAAVKDRLGLAWVFGQATAQRHLAQAELVATAQRQPLLRKKYDELRASLAADSSSAETNVGTVAVSRLHTQIHALEAAAGLDTRDYGQLHRVRIEGKHLRYAVEIVAHCFKPELRTELYPRLERMQDLLGAANDHHVASTRLQELIDFTKKYRDPHWPLCRRGAEGLLRAHRRGLTSARQQFRRFWAKWQKEQVTAQFLNILTVAPSP